MSPRPIREKKPAEGDAAGAEAPALPLTAEEVAFHKRAALVGANAERDAIIAEHGGRRTLPPVPTPEQLEAHQAKLAAQPPREPTDEELGLGELGIPERRVKGIGAAWNFTVGPVLIYKGPADLDRIHKLEEPRIIVAKYIPEMELKKMNRTRVRGFVIEQGSVIDPTYWFYRDENRACVVSAKGAVALALEGERAVVDGVRGVAYFGPDAGTLRDYQYLRRIGPPADDPLLRDAVRHLAGAVMGARIKEKQLPPYDFDEQERLIAVAKKARVGEPISAEDDAWMKSIILVGMPTVDAMLATAKKPKEIAAPEPRKKDAGAEDDDAADEASDAPKSRAQQAREAQAAKDAERRGEKSAEADAKRDDAKPESKKDEPQAAKADEPKAKAEDARAATPDEEKGDAKPDAAKPETAEDKVAARKAQRDAEVAALRAARGKKDDKS